MSSYEMGPGGGEFLNELRYRYITTKKPVNNAMAGINNNKTAIFI